MNALIELAETVNRPIEAGRFVDKLTYAKRWKGSRRWVDNLLAQGMPHLKTSERRVRIDVIEADQWMKERFGTRRIGPANLRSSKDTNEETSHAKGFHELAK